MGLRCGLDNLICFGLVVIGCRRMAIVARCNSSLDAFGSRSRSCCSMASSQQGMWTQRCSTYCTTLAGTYLKTLQCANIWAMLKTFISPQTSVYCSLPLRLMSRGWGWIAERNVPESFRPSIYGLYSAAFGVNLEEALISDLKYVHQPLFISFWNEIKFVVEPPEPIFNLFRSKAFGDAYVNWLMIEVQQTIFIILVLFWWWWLCLPCAAFKFQNYALCKPNYESF